MKIMIDFRINFFYQLHTQAAEMFGVGDSWLKTRLNIKILSHPDIQEPFTDFHGDEAKNTLF